jgi:hypothetical protein
MLPLKAWKKPLPPKRPEPGQSAGRAGLSVENIEETASFFFARKFSLQEDPAIFDYIDQCIHQQKP